MLLIRVFSNIGLVEFFDPRPYSPEWHMHRSDEIYLGIVRNFCHEVETPDIGDIVVFRYGRCYSHGGIVTRADPLTIVHAFLPYGMVVEEGVSTNVRLCEPERRPLFFSRWDE